MGMLPGLPDAYSFFGMSQHEIARALTLRRAPLPVVRPELNVPGVLSALDDHLGQLQGAQKLFLPNLELSKSLAVFTDFSNHSSAKNDFDTYAMLITDLSMVSKFSDDVRVIRHQYRMSSNYTFAYKSLSSARAVAAMHPFMAAVDRIPGLMVVIAVPRRVTSLFAATRKELRQLVVESGLMPAPHEVSETTLRVTQFLAYFLGLLGHEGQHVFWMTDNDAIAANSKLKEQLGGIFGYAVEQLCPKRFGRIGIATPFDGEHVDFEAMLSIPDLYAGCIAKALTQNGRKQPISPKAGAELVLRMLNHQGVFLKKLVLLADIFDGDKAAISRLEFDWSGPDPYQTTILTLSE